MDLVLLNYNKYKNRQFKREETISGYFDKAKSYEIIEDYDFNPADGVSTSVILGGEYYDYEDKYDYLIVCDGDEIVSRWFILDTDRTRIGQYRVSLQRDCVVDNFEIIANTPAFINKATLAEDDPLVLTKEPVSVNEIKTSETILTDETECAWIVGYLDRKFPETTGTVTQEVKFKSEIIDDYDSFDYSNGQYFQLLTPNVSEISFNVGFYSLTQGFNLRRDKDTKRFIVSDASYARGSYLKGGLKNTITSNANMLTEYFKNLTQAQVDAIVTPPRGGSWATAETIADLMKYQGKIVKKGSIHYRVLISTTRTNFRSEIVGATRESLDNVMYQMGYTTGQSEVPGITAEASIYQISLIKIDVGEFHINLPNSGNRYNLKDAPYDLFCIPYPLKNGSVTYGGCTISTMTAMQIAQGLATALGSHLYDLQLLPFCPISVQVNATGDILLQGEENLRKTEVLSSSNLTVAYVLWATASQGYAAIKTPDIIADNVKMANQCDKYRLVSGSYGSAFEINIAKNGGKLKGFSADYTYVPYNPYIHVNPEFYGLYGQDFDDCRGLVDQGEKSISYMSDAWQQYQINNKTYQQQFDREIQNMEYNHKWDMAESVLSAITSAVGIGVGAGVLGGKGAGIGVGALSLAGGIADQYINKARFGEAEQFKKDMHELSLANIKAMPNTIAKLTSFSKNNKVFPVLEYYTCTDREKEAFANYVRYNGMTCGVIGKISDYLDNSWEYNGIKDKGYIQATLLQVEDLPGDNHMVDAINYELERGVFFK